MSSSSNNHYIRAETSARIDACFGGVVVQSPGNKFQYFQDRNKRWPFTCSEKGCACLRVFFSSPLSLFQSLSPIFSLSFFFCKRAARCVCVCSPFLRARVWCVDVCRRRRRREDDLVGGVSCFLFFVLVSKRARRIFCFFFSIVRVLPTTAAAAAAATVLLFFSRLTRRTDFFFPLSMMMMKRQTRC